MTVADALFALAVAEVLRREAEDNRRPEGADFAAIVADVAARYGLLPVELGKAAVGITEPN